MFAADATRVGTCFKDLMTLTVMKKSFKKFQPRIINYRSYKHFSNDTFRKDLIDKLSNEELVINDDGMKRFCELSINILNKHYLAR